MVGDAFPALTLREVRRTREPRARFLWVTEGRVRNTVCTWLGGHF